MLVFKQEKTYLILNVAGKVASKRINYKSDLTDYLFINKLPNQFKKKCNKIIIIIKTIWQGHYNSLRQLLCARNLKVFFLKRT